MAVNAPRPMRLLVAALGFFVLVVTVRFLAGAGGGGGAPRAARSLLVVTAVVGENYLPLLPIFLHAIRDAHGASHHRPGGYHVVIVTDTAFEAALTGHLDAHEPAWKRHVDVFAVEQWSGQDNFLEGNMFLRYRVVEWPKIQQYQAALHIDVDVLMTRPLWPQIEKMMPLVYYVTPEGRHDMRFYSLGDGYSKAELERFEKLGIRAFNAGTFAFLIVPEMLAEIAAMLKWAQMELIRGTRHFADQSFINVWMNTRGLSDTQLLAPVIMGNAGLLDPRIYRPMKTLLHFYGEHAIGTISEEEAFKLRNDPELMKQSAKRATDSKFKLMRRVFYNILCKSDCIKVDPPKTVTCDEARDMYYKDFAFLVTKEKYPHPLRHFYEVGVALGLVWRATMYCELNSKADPQTGKVAMVKRGPSQIMLGSSKTCDEAREHYRRQYPDVREDLFKDPFEHFITHGIKEGRMWTGPLNCNEQKFRMFVPDEKKKDGK